MKSLKRIEANRKVFLLILAVGLAIRLGLCYFQYSGDINNFIGWADSFLSSSDNFYEKEFIDITPPNYPPLSIYFFGFWRWLYRLIKAFTWQVNCTVKAFPSQLVYLIGSQNMQAAIMKMPAILGDIGASYLIYFLAGKSLLIMSLYLFNPAVIYISSVWGQIESVPIFFVLLTIYFIKKNNQQSYYLSHLTFITAVLFKQTALWLLPIFLITWYGVRPVKILIKGLLIQLLVFWISYLPITGLGFECFRLFVSTLSGSSKFTADGAWNFWRLIFPDQFPDYISVGPLTVRSWSLLILICLYLAICISFWYKNNVNNLANYLLLIALVAFFFQTRVHERHLAYAIPLILISKFKLNNLLAIYITLSLFHYLNLVNVLKLPFI
jgi:Gpi18-like mannosyltransferase